MKKAIMNGIGGKIYFGGFKRGNYSESTREKCSEKAFERFGKVIKG